VLQHSGFPNVQTASSGEEALDIIANRTLDLGILVTDLSMGGIDGVELYSRINKIYTQKKVNYVPGILITGFNIPQKDHEFQTMKGYVLHKPVNNDTLIATLQRALQGPNPYYVTT